MNTFEVVAGFAAMVASFAMAARHILLSPSSSAWPRAPRWLCRVLFGGSVVMLYGGMNLVFAGVDQVRLPPTDRLQLIALLLATVAVVESAFVWNLLVQRLPARLTARLERLAAIVRGKPASAGQILQPAELAALAATTKSGSVWAPAADALHPVRADQV